MDTEIAVGIIELDEDVRRRKRKLSFLSIDGVERVLCVLGSWAIDETAARKMAMVATTIDFRLE